MCRILMIFFFGGGGVTYLDQRPYIIETMHSYTLPMLIWAAPIPADRWHCSLWP